MTKLTIATWNINSVRLRLPLLADFLRSHGPDIVCLQETKAEDVHFPLQAIQDLGYGHVLFSGMKSYNGVAILSKMPLARLDQPDWCGKKDCRAIAARLPNGMEIYNYYIPAGGDIPDPKLNDKFAHKLDFVKSLTDYWRKNMCAKTPRILAGDLNIAPMEHDVWSHKQLLDVVSHTPIEVELLSKMQAANDWVDAIRHFVPADQKLYSWWSYRAQDWEKSNRGRRLDHIWISPSLKNNLHAYNIIKLMRGGDRPSDHVPVMVELKM